MLSGEGAEEKEKEKERESDECIDNQPVTEVFMKVGKYNVLSGNTASGHSTDQVWERVLTPHSLFGLVARLGGYWRAQTPGCESQSPSRRAPWDVPPPLGGGFGIPNRSLTTWHDERAEIIAFPYMPPLLGEKGMISHVGWDAVDLPTQGQKL
jgi:hypothetical protein